MLMSTGPSGLYILYDKNSKIQIYRDTFVESITFSTSKKRFRKVLGKVARLVCPSCKKFVAPWIVRDTGGASSAIYLCHTTSNPCTATTEVTGVLVEYAYGKDIGIQNMTGNRKALMALTQGGQYKPQSRSAVMLYGKTARCSS